MQKYTPETVSDLIDRQLDGAKMDAPMDGVINDPELVKCWRNYHLIGDVIRGDVRVTGNCLLSKIEQGIADQPAHNASDAGIGRSGRGANHSNVVSLASLDAKNKFAKNKIDSANAWKSAAMFAVAASVALMAVLTLKPGGDEFDAAIVAGSNLAATTPSTITPSAIPVASPLPADPAIAVEDLASFESEFGQMMVEHGEFTATSGLNGLLTYAKLVSNEGLGQ